MTKFGFQLKKYQDWFNQRTPRERGMIVAASLVVVAFGLYSLLVVPQRTEQARLQEQTKALKEQTEALRKQAADIQKTYGQNEGEGGQAHIEALRKQLAAMDPALADVTQSLVSPKEMASLVEQVLRQNRALEVISVESLPVTPLIQPVTTAEAAAPAGQAADSGAGQADTASSVEDGGFYKHGMVIEVRGRYADIVSYLRALENLPWKVFWGQITLVAEGYPKSRVRLVIYTLSLNPKWIGI